MKPLPKQSPESARALGAGLTFAVTVALFAWGGLWLDQSWGTRPWLLVALTLLGVVGGGIHVVHELAPEALGKWSRPRRMPPPGPPPGPTDERKP